MELVPHEKKRGDTKDHPLSQWFSNFSEADELLKLAAARQQVRFNCPYSLRFITMLVNTARSIPAFSST